MGKTPTFSQAAYLIPVTDTTISCSYQNMDIPVICHAYYEQQSNYKIYKIHKNTVTHTSK